MYAPIAPTLSDGSPSVLAAGCHEAKWYAVLTRSRHEKVLHAELLKKQIESFLPLRKVTRHWSDRRQIVDEPLFAGYLFVNIPISQRLSVLRSVGAVRLVGPRFDESACDVPASEIIAVRRFIESGLRVDPFPYLKAGQRVRIRRGPLQGIEGFVVSKRGQLRLVISVEIMMQSVSIEIDESCIERL